MAECPFCNAPVDDSLVRDGGRCPRCFIEIPGEEAPTNPGVDTHAEPPVEAGPPPTRRLWIGAGIATILLLAGSVAAWKVHHDRRERARAAEAVPTFYLEPLGEVVAQVDDAAATPTGSGAAEPRPHPRTGGSAGEEVVPSDGPRTPVRWDFTDAEADAAFSGLAEPAGPRTLSLGMPQDPDGPVRLRRAGAAAYVLTDPDEIRAAVGSAIRNYQGQVSQCYTQRLKSAPGVKGTWILALTILPDGSTSDVHFTPQGAADAEIEACVIRRATTWTFQPMIQAQRFELPFTFGSGT